MSTVKNAWDFEGAEENSRDRLRSENIFRNAISESLSLGVSKYRVMHYAIEIGENAKPKKKMAYIIR